MSEAIIKVTNSAYARYEELLLERDAVRKEAFMLDRAYTREFGDITLKLFETKLECIRKKKAIEFCQTFANRGESVDQEALQEHLEKEMTEYKEQLEEMVREREAARGKGTVTEAQLIEIRQAYRRLVKKLHPDINPETTDNKELNDLWQRISIAYTCNNLEELQEVEVLVAAALEKAGITDMEVTIPDIDDKIAALEAEIAKIKSEDPYQYKFLLDDPSAVKEKKDSLNATIKEYEDYSKQLDEVLEGFVLQGVKFTWQMN